MEIPYTVQPREDTGVFNAKLGIWLFLASEVMLFGALFSSYILLRVGSDHWPHGLLNVWIGMFNTFVLITSSITMVFAWAHAKLNNPSKSRFYLGITILCGAMFLGVKSKEYYDKFTHYGIEMMDGSLVSGHLVENAKDYVVIHPDEEAHQLAVALGIRPSPGADLHKARAGAEPKDGAAANQDPVPKLSAPDKHAAGGGHELKIERSKIRRIASYGPWYSTFFAIYFTLTGLHGLHVLGGMVVLFYFWGPGFKMFKKEPERYANRLEVGGLFWHFVDLVWIFLFPVLYLL